MVLRVVGVVAVVVVDVVVVVVVVVVSHGRKYKRNTFYLYSGAENWPSFC